MRTVWVICSVVDLGYHMVKGYNSYDKAKAEFERMETEALEANIKYMMTAPHITLEYATESAKIRRYYELESVEIEE
jgi:hypothetical protein